MPDAMIEALTWYMGEGSIPSDVARRYAVEAANDALLALARDLLRGEGCDCDGALDAVPLTDGLQFTHKHAPGCAYALAHRLAPGDVVTGRLMIS